MKNKNNIIIILISIIIILSASCVYLYTKVNKPIFNISIGTPTSEDSTMFGLEIKDKDAVNDILLSLIRAESIDKISITNSLPDAIIRLDDTSIGVCYLSLNAWISEDEVIISLNEGDDLSFKKISGQLAKDLINYISEYK